MTKTENLFYEAMKIVELNDFEKYVVGCFDFTYGVKTFTSAIEKAKDRINLAKAIEKHTGKSKTEEIEKMEKIITVLEKSKDCMTKKKAVEKEISKRLAELPVREEFDYIAICHDVDRVRKEVEAEFYA